MITPVRWWLADSGRGRRDGSDARVFAGLAELCDEHQALLVFDEVQSGMGGPAICLPICTTA